MQFQCFSRLLAKNFHVLRKRIRQRCRVRNLRVRRNFKRKTGRTRKAFYVSSGAEHFGEVILAETKTFCFLGNERKIASFLAKHFWRSCQHRIPYVHGKSLRQAGFFPKKSKFDILFWFLMKKFLTCGRCLQQGCQKQNLRDQRKFLVKLYLEEYTTLYLLMVFLRKIWFAKKLQVRQWGIVRAQWNILRDEVLEETKPF